MIREGSPRFYAIKFSRISRFYVRYFLVNVRADGLTRHGARGRGVTREINEQRGTNNALPIPVTAARSSAALAVNYRSLHLGLFFRNIFHACRFVALSCDLPAARIINASRASRARRIED